jgi:hypothetical protein
MTPPAATSDRQAPAPVRERPAPSETPAHCQVCGAERAPGDSILCRVCGEPVIILGWAP